MKSIFKILTIAIFILTSFTMLYAEDLKGSHDHNSPQHEGMDHSVHTSEASDKTKAKIGECSGDVKMKVSGLVCDFCARALEKVFSKKDEVDSIKVDLSSGLITVKVKEGKTLVDSDLRKLIVDSGYNINEITEGCLGGK